MSLTKLLKELDGDQLLDVWVALGFEFDDMPDSKTRRINIIQAKTTRHKRLDSLFRILFDMNLLPNARPFFPLIIVQYCRTAWLKNPTGDEYPLKNICAAIGSVPCKQLLLTDLGYHTWSSENLVLTEQAQALQAFMERNGRFPDLLNAIQQQSTKLDLTPFYADLPEQKHRTVAASPPASQERVYHNFDVRIRGKNINGRYPIEVKNNLFGKSSDTEQTINPNATYFVELINSITPSSKQKADEEKIRELGRYLHELLFPDRVKWMLFDSITHVAEKGDGLRIRLQIEPPELQKLPWEYCYSDDFGYYALRLDTPIVRYEKRPFTSQSLPVPSPLKVLVVVSEPHDKDDLNVEKEVQIISNILGLMGGNVQLEILKNAEISRMRRALNKNPHIFHFIGHGEQRGNNAGTLTFEDKFGGSHEITGEQLMVQLRGLGIKTIILNACKTAGSGTQNAFGSVATALIRAEIPAVIAMKFNIRDDVALGFTRDLYSGLVAGQPLDTAVTNMRIGAHTLGESHWGIPTLYMHSPNGKIWQYDPHIEQEFHNAVNALPDLNDESLADLLGEVQRMMVLHSNKINTRDLEYIYRGFDDGIEELNEPSPDLASIEKILGRLMGDLGYTEITAVINNILPKVRHILEQAQSKFSIDN